VLRNAAQKVLIMFPLKLQPKIVTQMLSIGVEVATRKVFYSLSGIFHGYISVCCMDCLLDTCQCASERLRTLL